MLWSRGATCRCARATAASAWSAWDENTRLRRDLTGVRAHVFELERKNDELNREISVLRMKLEKLEESAKEQANADE